MARHYKFWPLLLLQRIPFLQQFYWNFIYYLREAFSDRAFCPRSKGMVGLLGSLCSNQRRMTRRRSSASFRSRICRGLRRSSVIFPPRYAPVAQSALPASVQYERWWRFPAAQPVVVAGSPAWCSALLPVTGPAVASDGRSPVPGHSAFHAHGVAAAQWSLLHGERHPAAVCRALPVCQLLAYRFWCQRIRRA